MDTAGSCVAQCRTYGPTPCLKAVAVAVDVLASTVSDSFHCLKETLGIGGEGGQRVGGNIIV